MTINHIHSIITGWPLPQPAVSRGVLNKILAALSLAWDEVQKSYPDDVRLPEINVSAHLAIAFMRVSKSDPLLRTVVCQVLSGPEIPNFNGEKIQKKPDIAIVWNGRDRMLPLLVECKLIDRKGDKRVSDYAALGVRRFVDGTYAWSEREAVMVAFVRDDSTIANDLVPHLQQVGTKTPDLLQVDDMPQKIEGALHRDAAISRHGRAFTYPLRPGEAPGPIELWHLWLGLDAEQEEVQAVA